MLRIIAALLLPPVLVAAQSPIPGSAQRRLAVTIDDLPWVGREPGDTVVAATDRLLATMIGWRVPAVGFVIQANAERRDRPEQPAHLLDRWLAAGVEMGNHTYGHRSANIIPPIAFLAEIVRGEPLVSRLSRQSGRPLRYFRHPYLHLGPDTAYRDGVARFLTSRGYRVAPVTIETRDYIFSSAYAEALRRGDAGFQQRVVDAYLTHIANAAEFFEEFSRDLTGYEPPQVILLHANRLNADHIGRVLELFRARGYRFVTLDEALRDPAYSLPDGYRGLQGASWTHRWAAGLGRKPRTEPKPPPWILSLVSGAAVSGANRRH